MPSNFDEAFAAVQSLVKDFDAHKGHYLSPAYKEAEVRIAFIDKFLIALGWDVKLDTQKNPGAQEVKIEPGVSMGGSERRADYAFYIAPRFQKDDVRFFVEAKKPSVDIGTPDNCFQTLGYGFSAETPLAVLTDFEQFHILDCRYKPNKHTATAQTLRKYHFADYTNKEKFAEIFHLFSRDAVAAGSLEKFSGTLPKKRGYLSLNDAFLEELDKHRDTLARAFKNRNPDLDGDTLTEITQRTLDRLVFIRFLEDKLIHSENLVANFGDKGTAWQDFVAASRKLDGIYNGIVFKAHAILDVPGFKVDDDAFAGICEELSPANTAYNFNYISIQILGSIYERFLGKVIVTTGKRARVEEKPEVRKAGGVHYTPQYIARYLVENTVGKLIAGKTPAQIAKMTFADISCGSGSILLAAYDLLLVYHRDWFNANPDKAKKAGCVLRDDDAWHLSLKQRREILVNNIYGVDIDRQAVEVAQLSLYLKLLEEETTGTAREYQMEFHETLLPSLAKNIVCGNSLIGTDILSGKLFEPVEERKLNPMDFEDRFPQIFRRKTSSGELRDAPLQSDYTMPGVPLHGSFSYRKSKKDKTAPSPALPESEFEGGFDAIVGNPPWISAWTSSAIERDYLTKKFRLLKGHWDFYLAFLLKSLGLLSNNGKHGFIYPTSLLTEPYAADVRKKLIQDGAITELDVFGVERVFSKVSRKVCILLLQKQVNTLPTIIKSWEAGIVLNQSTLDPKKWLGNHNAIINAETSGATSKIKEKIETQSCKAGNIYYVNYGAQICSKEKGAFSQDRLLGSVKRGNAKKCLTGSEVKKYRAAWAGLYLDYQPEIMYGPRHSLFFESPKILVNKTSGKGYGLVATFDEANFYCDQRIICLVRYEHLQGSSLRLDFEGFPKIDRCESELFHTGLLNSSLLSYFFSNCVATKNLQGQYTDVVPKMVRSLPLRIIDFADKADKARHDKMVLLVEQMLATKPQLARAQSDKDKDFYENKCAALDRQIDALVYELYALTADEIKIVEGSTK